MQFGGGQQGGAQSGFVAHCRRCPPSFTSVFGSNPRGHPAQRRNAQRLHTPLLRQALQHGLGGDEHIAGHTRIELLQHHAHRTKACLQVDAQCRHFCGQCIGQPLRSAAAEHVNGGAHYSPAFAPENFTIFSHLTMSACV